MNIDHHLQLSMITRLLKSEIPLKYGELKDDTIESSLFSYHLNKLIARGMIVKYDTGYSITVEGARWLNDNGNFMHNREALRIYIALVVLDSRGRYLIAQRKGQFGVAINDYMLPSKRYTNDLDLPEQVERVIEKIIPVASLLEQINYGFVQIKPTYKDNSTIRGLFNITVCRTDTFEPPEASDLTSYTWLLADDISSFDYPSTVILKGIIDYVSNTKNQHSTPVIVG